MTDTNLDRFASLLSQTSYCYIIIYEYRRSREV